MISRQFDTEVGRSRRPGYVLIAVLVVIVVLSLAAYRYSDMMFAEYRATDRILKSAEAKALADSGIHYAAAIVADPNAMTTLGNNPYDNQSFFKDKSVPLGNGRQGLFSVVAPDYTQDTGTGSVPLRYGVVDEASKINLNALVALDPSAGGIAYKALSLLPNMTDDIAYSIIDWIDTDDNTSPGGGEDGYYMGLTPPYHCKNGPLDSVEELLLVKGVTPALLFGDDLNRNGQRDPGEGTGGAFSFGLAPYFTVYSRESNVDSSGQPRINVNGKNMQTLLPSLQTAVGNDLAAYLVAYRIYGAYTAPAANPKSRTPAPVKGTSTQLYTMMTAALKTNPPNAKQTISSIWSLFGTSVGVPGTGNLPTTVFTFPISDPSKAKDSLPPLLDKVTTKSDKVLAGRINVITASNTVLTTLPGLAETDVTAIVAARPASGSATEPLYQSTAWLYTDAQISPKKMAALEQYITARTQIYRIQSVGYFEKSGPVIRVEAVVDSNNGKPRFLYYRDLTELGRSIDPRQQ